jgi:hypothetical protein
MTKLDLVIILIAAILGTFNASMTVGKIGLHVGWLVLALWALFKLFAIL